MNREERGVAEARLRTSVRGAVAQEGARVGFLLDSSGMVSAAGGNPGAVDPASFVSLASAQLDAARHLAPIASGGDLTQLVQEGGRSRLVLSAIHGERTLALLYDHVPDHRGGTLITGAMGPGGYPDVTEVDQAAMALQGGATDDSESDGSLGEGWSREAEGEVDRVFGGDG